MSSRLRGGLDVTSLWAKRDVAVWSCADVEG